MKAFALQVPLPTPEQLATLVQSTAPAFWLDSAASGHPEAQVSLLALDPLLHRSTKNFSEFADFAKEADAGLLSFRGAERRGILHGFGGGSLTPFGMTGLDTSPFSGGWIGCLNYEGEADFFLFDTWLEIETASGEARVHSLGLTENLRESDQGLAERRARHLAERLAKAAPALRAWQVKSLRAESTRETYLERVRDIQERLRRGDCYQVNLSQAFLATGEGDAADLYLRLRAQAPAPQMAFVNLGAEQIFSASPETLLKTEGSRAFSYPIKGTRKRAADPLQDRRLAEELLASPKDAAELLMIVDLVRNDLGAVSRPGSVRVTALKELESLPQVHHLYARVESLLLEGVGPLQALQRLSPGGSITGAPKLKAMEIIAELEGRPRGIYTGSLGYAGFSGRACFNIAIRTARLRPGSLEYRAGGGIVVDSDPDLEYEECLHKAKGFFLALGAEPALD